MKSSGRDRRVCRRVDSLWDAMQEAHTRSANRVLVQVRVYSIEHALELEPRVMLESTLRERLFNGGACYLSAVLRSGRIETLACEFIHVYPLARGASTPRNRTLLRAPGVPKGVDGANP